MATDDFAYAVFSHELARQARFGLRAAQQYRSVVAAGKFDEMDFWDPVQGLLIAAGNVSKILWPVKEYSARGKALRKMLAVSDDCVLANRLLRNHFEHIDERIEIWIRGSNGMFIDSNIGPASAEEMFGDLGSALRHYNSITDAVSFADETYEMKPIVDELQRVHDRAVPIATAGLHGPEIIGQ